MTILSKPWRIDRRGERIYVDAPGEVCIDLCSGTQEDRARVMALAAQAQAMAVALLAIREVAIQKQSWDGPGCRHIDDVLRAAGVLDE